VVLAFSVVEDFLLRRRTTRGASASAAAAHHVVLLISWRLPGDDPATLAREQLPRHTLLAAVCCLLASLPCGARSGLLDHLSSPASHTYGTTGPVVAVSN
jgi:hypothetical protein